MQMKAKAKGTRNPNAYRRNCQIPTAKSQKFGSIGMYWDLGFLALASLVLLGFGISDKAANRKFYILPFPLEKFRR